MDGKDREDFVKKEKVFWANGLALDEPADKLFWIDAKTATVNRANLDSSNVTVSSNYSNKLVSLKHF